MYGVQVDFKPRPQPGQCSGSGHKKAGGIGTWAGGHGPCSTCTYVFLIHVVHIPVLVCTCRGSLPAKLPASLLQVGASRHQALEAAVAISGQLRIWSQLMRRALHGNLFTKEAIVFLFIVGGIGKWIRLPARLIDSSKGGVPRR